jgi:hypothetical protein
VGGVGRVERAGGGELSTSRELDAMSNLSEAPATLANAVQIESPPHPTPLPASGERERTFRTRVEAHMR